MSALTVPVRRLALPWPLPALLSWLLGWTLWSATPALGLSTPAAFTIASAAGFACALAVRGRWRRCLVGAGFPLSALAAGAALPVWCWPLALLPLLLAYPLRAWSDAPWFPTPVHALEGLDRIIALAPSARVLDVGCGIGHGLSALRCVWPHIRLEGVEWSRPLAWLAARRCSWAEVVRADMWRHSWAGVDLVYLFQRPESMARAFAKAEAEMSPGAWLVSLAFAVPGRQPVARIGGPSRRGVWIYRVGMPASTNAHSRR
ncbi:MAG: class I SAM-dependent methyltransferase [Pseudomonadota bacterium]